MALDEAQAENKTLLMHEHPQFALDLDRAVSYVRSEWQQSASKNPHNITLAPDDLLLHPGTIPIFTFKHPAFICRDGYRFLSTQAPDGENNHSGILITTNLRWQRELYDWYLSNNIRPILVESEDYMTSPAYVKKICKAAGSDEEAAVFKWDKVPEEEQKKMHPQVQILLKTLMNSEDLRPELAVKGGESVEVEKEPEKWREEFGEEAARFIRSEVEANMEDYWYLRERKLAL